MPHLLRSHSSFVVFVSSIAAGLGAAATASAEPMRIEVVPLENGSSLAAGDVAVLDSLVLSALSELPQDRFEIAAGPANADPACDKACRTAAARSRGAGRVVLCSIAAFGDGFLAALEAYDAASGQLLGSATTGAVTQATDLLGEIKEAAAELRAVIDPSRIEATPTPTPSSAYAQVAPAPASAPVTATLRVETLPPGAKVYIKRVGHTELIGKSPVERILLPVEYRVIARLAEHEPARRDVRLDPFEEEIVRLKLQRIYPMSPKKKWGHAAFWSGLAVTGFGFTAMAAARHRAEQYELTLENSVRDNARAWTGGMWASFGVGAALMTTGVILWAGTPSSKEHWEKTHGKLAITPTPDGGAVAAYGGRF